MGKGELGFIERETSHFCSPSHLGKCLKSPNMKLLARNKVSGNIQRNSSPAVAYYKHVCKM